MEFNELAKSRRAVNFFDTARPLPDGVLRNIVETAALTPSSFNLQPWSLLVLEEQDEKDRLRKLAMNQPKVSEAPVVLIVLADRDGYKQGHEFMERNFQEMVKAGGSEKQYDWYVNACNSLYGKSGDSAQAFACKNTGFFAMSLMYAAKGLGVDSHPMDGFDHDGVKKEFNIPDRYWVPLLIALGYFDESKDLQPAKWRKSYEEIVVKF